MKIYLVGYQPKFYQKKHTNFWPWQYLATTFKELGYDAFHQNVNKIDHSKPNVYICWNQPDSIELIEKYQPHKGSIIIQKLTSFDGSKESANTDWSDNPEDFFKNWHWPQYQKLDYLEKSGYTYFAFGAKTDNDTFPIKRKIVEKHKDRIFWIPWGSMTVSYDDIQKAKPIMNDFKYDIAFVGSRWGTRYRGNILEWETYLDPLINKARSSMIAGRGTKNGEVSVDKHIQILKQSKFCPILHASSWKVEKGIMDRFWTVFSLGRFGVVDNEGILDFYNENEVVLARTPEEYIDKSLYYMQNIHKQLSYIEAIQSRIKTEYNQQVVWKKILETVFKK